MRKPSPFPVFAIALFIASLGLLAYAYDRSGFWFGASAVFLLWWADNDRKQLRAKRREETLVEQFAPELMGKSFTEASAYIITALNNFKSSASPAVFQSFSAALAAHQAEWAGRGTPMPQWATMRLLREFEASHSNAASEVQ